MVWLSELLLPKNFYLSYNVISVRFKMIYKDEKKEIIITGKQGEMQEEFFRSLYDNISIGLYRSTPDGKLIMANPAMIRLTGYDSFEELSALNLDEDSEKMGYPRKKFKTLLNNCGELIGFESKFRRKDGTLIYIRENSRAVRDSNGKILYYEGTIEDISEIKRMYEALEKSKNELEKHVEERTLELVRINKQLEVELEKRTRMEKELSESEEKFKILAERSFVGIFIWQNGSFKYYNPAFAFMFAYTKKELKKKTFKDLTLARDWPTVEGKLQRLINGQTFSSHFQFAGRRKDKKAVFLEVHEGRIIYNDQPAIIGTFIDVTHMKKIEKDLKDKTAQLEELNQTLEKRIEVEIIKSRQQEQLLMQQSKLVSMGEMVGAIAHQWRQPLTSIGFIIQNLQSAYELGIFNETYLANSVEEAMLLIKYMSKTIDDFRNFFVFSKEKERFDVVKNIEESLYLLHAHLVNNYIFVKMNFPEQMRFTIFGFPNEFKQVILNIINNAKNAIIERRESENMPDEKGEIVIDIEYSNNKIFIKIRNNGERIPSEIMERIFEPYFTTNKNGKGMGIGLYMSKTIIEKNMGGTIVAENVNDGACFTIELSSEVENEYPE